DKAALFRAVVEDVEGDVMARLTEVVVSAAPASAAAALRVAADAWLDIAVEPEVRQLILLDGPTVLGWAGFREVAQQYGLGMTEQLLTAAIDAGEIPAQPARPLASVLLGAIDEAAMYIAEAPDIATAQAEVRQVLGLLIDGVLASSADR